MKSMRSDIESGSFPNRWLIALTVLAALIYIIGSLYTTFGTAHNTGQSLNSVLFGSPRGAIVLCWALAAFSIAVLPEIEIGKFLSGIFLCGVVVFFGVWWDKTAAIQRNVGPENYHTPNWIQNYFIGGGYLDLIGLALAVGLIFLYVYVIGKSLRRYRYHPNLLRTSK
jgi:hypothetical protein